MHKHVFFLPNNACCYLKYPHQQFYLPFSRATHNATSTSKPFSLKAVSSSYENLLVSSCLSLLYYFPQFDVLLQTTGFMSKHLFYISTFDYCLQMLNIQLSNEGCQNAYFLKIIQVQRYFKQPSQNLGFHISKLCFSIRETPSLKRNSGPSDKTSP